MSNDTGAGKPARPTLADQLARQHELLMAAATKPARQGAQTVEYGKQTTGANAGDLYVKSLVLVQRDDEPDVMFLGRQEATLRKVNAMLEAVNAEPATEPEAESGETE